MKAKLAKPVIMLVLAVVAMGIASCGSGGNGSATSYFKTVTITPVGTTQNTTTTVLASNNTAAPAVVVSLQSTVYPGITGSQVTIKSSTISYTKTSNSPSTAPATLPSQSGPLGTVQAGGSASFSFNVASGIYKDNLVTNSGFVPNGQKWEYYVTFYFNAHEDNTNTDITFSVPGGTVTFQ